MTALHALVTITLLLQAQHAQLVPMVTLLQALGKSSATFVQVGFLVHLHTHLATRVALRQAQFLVSKVSTSQALHARHAVIMDGLQVVLTLQTTAPPPLALPVKLVTMGTVRHAPSAL